MWRLRMCHKCFLDSTNILQISPIYSWHWHIPLILSTRYPKYIFLSAVWHKSRNISGFKTIQKESRQYRWIQDNTSWVKRLAGYCHVLLTIWTGNRQTAPFGLHTYLAYKNVICIHKKIRCDLLQGCGNRPHTPAINHILKASNYPIFNWFIWEIQKLWTYARPMTQWQLCIDTGVNCFTLFLFFILFITHWQGVNCFTFFQFFI